MLPRVVIVGRPNVGKSSLLNTLSKRKISIVDDVPGVTRDRVGSIIELPLRYRTSLDAEPDTSAGEDVADAALEDEEAEAKPRYIEIVDTGGYGIIDSQDLTADVEKQIAYAVADADLILFVVDAQQGIVPLDETVAKLLRTSDLDVPVMLIANKVDSMNHEPAAYNVMSLGLGEPVMVSAETKHNLHDLYEAIWKTLPEGIFDERRSLLNPGIQLAIVGKRNAGKSTLVNSLAGEERVIVSDVEGTTRDSVDVRIEVELDEQTFDSIREAEAQNEEIRAVSAVENSSWANWDQDASGDWQSPFAQAEGDESEEDDWDDFDPDEDQTAEALDEQVDDDDVDTQFGAQFNAESADQDEDDDNTVYIHDELDIDDDDMALWSEGDDGQVRVIDEQELNDEADLAGQSQQDAQSAGENAAQVGLYDPTIREDRPEFGIWRSPLTEDGKLIYTLIDTAGMRKRKSLQDDIEYYSMHRSLRSVRRADVVLLVIDATLKVSNVDQQLANEIVRHDRPVAIVINKWDKVDPTGEDEELQEKFAEYLDRELKMIRYAPIVFISALEADGIGEVLGVAENLYRQSRSRMTTGELNQLVGSLLAERKPRNKGGKQGKIFFATQPHVDPPTIVFQVNNPHLFDNNYQLFMMNRMRDVVPFSEVPIKLSFRGKERRYKK